MKQQYELCKRQFVSSVTGVIRTLHQNFVTNLVKVSARQCAATIQKEVMLRAAHILQHILADMVF
eukprot:5694746-Ditylum_brightwellii.AAC.1